MGVRDTNQDSTTALTEAVAERLRGRLAEKRIRQNEVMLATGWAKTTAWRKMGGKSPLDSDELSISGKRSGSPPSTYSPENGITAPSQVGLATK